MKVFVLFISFFIFFSCKKPRDKKEQTKVSEGTIDQIQDLEEDIDVEELRSVNEKFEEE